MSVECTERTRHLTNKTLFYGTTMGTNMGMSMTLNILIYSITVIENIFLERKKNRFFCYCPCYIKFIIYFFNTHCYLLCIYATVQFSNICVFNESFHLRPGQKILGTFCRSLFPGKYFESGLNDISQRVIFSSFVKLLRFKKFLNVFQQ